ncbi:unnamed protein product [Cuscuta campestris]|uniref:Uncharacterized protein n=1 Tax=Cuscuta campestris TaxID=132261 RepID=A0A484MT90_9ASTE|nr:unnamed protein product [Cuscuta campestris]
MASVHENHHVCDKSRDGIVCAETKVDRHGKMWSMVGARTDSPLLRVEYFVPILTAAGTAGFHSENPGAGFAESVCIKMAGISSGLPAA